MIRCDNPTCRAAIDPDPLEDPVTYLYHHGWRPVEEGSWKKVHCPRCDEELG
jgi:rhamnogalacturonyl hydrolase YesR